MVISFSYSNGFLSLAVNKQHHFLKPCLSVCKNNKYHSWKCQKIQTRDNNIYLSMADLFHYVITYMWNLKNKTMKLIMIQREGYLWESPGMSVRGSGTGLLCAGSPAPLWTLFPLRSDGGHCTSSWFPKERGSRSSTLMCTAQCPMHARAL